MNDLTLLYVTDNVMEETTRKKVADYLLKVTENKYPIVSVSQKPIDLGKNILFEANKKSKFNVYKQIHIGVREVETKYVATIDDDTLYTPEHFLYRPPDDLFAYETNCWFALPYWDYYWREHNPNKRSGTWGCISNTKLMQDNLDHRFKLYPTEESMGTLVNGRPLIWGEPGINDVSYGLPNKFTRFHSEKPCVIFIHGVSMGYNQFRKWHRRYGYPLPEDRTETVEPFGNIKDLYKEYFNI
jgi:hypothetical protein